MNKLFEVMHQTYPSVQVFVCYDFLGQVQELEVTKKFYLLNWVSCLLWYLLIACGLYLFGSFQLALFSLQGVPQNLSVFGQKKTKNLFFYSKKIKIKRTIDYICFMDESDLNFLSITKKVVIQHQCVIANMMDKAELCICVIGQFTTNNGVALLIFASFYAYWNRTKH